MENKNISVLCIDDEESIRFALCAVIESQGWKAYSAKNVYEGLLKIKEHNPEIILIDYHMPVINGLEGVKKIRLIDEKSPIIVFTIDSNQALAEKFMLAGATDFANKPIKAPDLISRINLHIKLLEKNPNEENDLIKSINLTKGIGESTLSLILDSLSKEEEFLTVEEISNLTELSYQTTYRYLQFLEQEDIIDVNITYGKIGRPKQSYKLKQRG